MLERQTHPYTPYLPKTAEAVIIGSAPPWRFCTGRTEDLRAGDVDFFYGSVDNRFWCVMFEVMGIKPEPVTVEQLKKILKDHKLGMGDILKSFTREDRKSVDTALSEFTYNISLVNEIMVRDRIRKLFFTSEFAYRHFKRALREQGYKLKQTAIARRQYTLSVSKPGFERKFEISVLLSPSRRGRHSFEDLVANYKEQFSQFF